MCVSKFGSKCGRPLSMTVGEFDWSAWFLCVGDKFFFPHFKSSRNLLFGTSSVDIDLFDKTTCFCLLGKCTLCFLYVLLRNSTIQCAVWHIQCHLLMKICQPPKVWVELRRELMFAIIHMHVIESISVISTHLSFFFFFKMLTSTKWVSVDITRTNQMDSRTIGCECWCIIDRMHRFFFLGSLQLSIDSVAVSWWIPSAMNFESAKGKKAALYGCDIARIWTVTIKIFYRVLFEISQDIFQQCLAKYFNANIASGLAALQLLRHCFGIASILVRHIFGLLNFQVRSLVLMLSMLDKWIIGNWLCR